MSKLSKPDPKKAGAAKDRSAMSDATAVQETSSSPLASASDAASPSKSSALVMNVLLGIGLAALAFIGFAWSAGWLKRDTHSPWSEMQAVDSKGGANEAANPLAELASSSNAMTSTASTSDPSASDQSLQGDPPPLDPALAVDSKAQIAEGKRVAEHLARSLPDSLDALEMRARFEFEFGSVESAKAIWQKLLERQSGYGHALVGLGNIATLEGDLSEAVNYYRRAVIADPSNLGQEIKLGVALIAAGELDEAKTVLESVVAKNSELPDALIELATAHLQLGDIEAARKNFDLALAIDAENPRVHQGLVTVFSRLQDQERAKHHQAEHERLRAVAGEPSATGRKSYDDVAALRIDVGKLYTLMARVYAASGNLKAAELLLVRAARMNEQDIDSRQNLAWLSSSQGRGFETIRWLSEISAVRPSDFSYAQEIARLYAQLDQLDETLATLEDFLNENPENAEVNQALANYYLDVAPDNEKAIKYALESVRLKPNSVAYSLLATIYFEADKKSEGITALERAVELDADNTQLRQMLALMRNSPPGDLPANAQRASNASESTSQSGESTPATVQPPSNSADNKSGREDSASADSVEADSAGTDSATKPAAADQPEQKE